MRQLVKIEPVDPSVLEAWIVGRGGELRASGLPASYLRSCVILTSFMTGADYLCLRACLPLLNSEHDPS